MDLERGLVSIYRKLTLEEKNNLKKWGSRIQRYRPLTIIERRKKYFATISMEDLTNFNQYKHPGIQEDPLCYLFNPNLSIWEIDEDNQKIQLARLLLKDQVVSIMDKRNEEEEDEDGWSCSDDYDEEEIPPVYEVENDDDW